jgi:hypothetical protein
MTNEHNKVWVNYMCGKKVKVNYKGNVDNFIKQLDECNKYVISIFMEGHDDELYHIPQGIKEVFCLISPIVYLKEGYVCQHISESMLDMTIMRIEKIKDFSKDKDQLVISGHTYEMGLNTLPATPRYVDSGYRTIFINKTHTTILNEESFLVVSDFVDPQDTDITFLNIPEHPIIMNKDFFIYDPL